jgi:transposase-like protein
MGKRITEQEKNHAVKLYRKGLSGKDVAEELDISSASVYNILDEKSVKTRTSAKTQKLELPLDEIIDLYLDQKLSTEEIAKKYNCGSETIRRRLHENNVELRDKAESLGGWNKGLTKENCESIARAAKKLSETRKQKFASGELVHWNEGNSCSEQVKDKISDTLKGRYLGADNPNWKGGKNTKNAQIRARYYGSRDYRKWRSHIFQRDNYTCQMCKKQSEGDIEAHHIITVEENPNKIVEKTNGITLCENCHRSIKGEEKKFELYFQSIVHYK